MEEKRKDPKEKKCAICGKDIYAGEEWAYKRREKSERTKWFCSYKCMREYDAKHGQKKTRPAGLPADMDAAAPKEPVSRAVVAKALEKEIKRGGSVIAYLKAEGYKNPYQAYDAVRHYCETKMPELAEVLKPLRDLPKGPYKKTGRPRKHPEVVTVDAVPDIETLEEQVAQQLNLQGGVNYQLKVEETMRAEAKPIGEYFRYQVTGIEMECGKFQRTRDMITFTHNMQEMIMLAKDWKQLAEQLPEALRVLGVTE